MPDQKTRTDATSPLALGPADRVAVVAGSGRLPLDVAQGLAALGHAPLVVRVRGEAADAAAFGGFDQEEIGLGQFATRLPSLRRRGITHLVLAGGIGRRPKFGEISVNWTLLRNLPRVVSALLQGDNGLLSILVNGIEREGIRVVGAHQVVPDLLAPEGTLTRTEPLASDRRDLRAALKAAKAIGDLDIGQGAVAIGGRVVALEGIEGTDGMLDRVKGLRGHGRLAGKQRGVLVKCAKPGQELRADLPTIGPATVDAASAAGLAGIGVEAEHALILDRAQTLARAEASGLFVVGLPRGVVP
ncbi:MAG: UDP-2,3-diacylglucosamine diphosphatase LpxI [Rhizobiaceae bacterium]|nr:UDP-2,3-diacylglucosamine diphosphatase LpxI [Rhizobiaceae bacterium]